MKKKFKVYDWAGNEKPYYGEHNSMEEAFDALDTYLPLIYPKATEEELAEQLAEFYVSDSGH